MNDMFIRFGFVVILSLISTVHSYAHNTLLTAAMRNASLADSAIDGVVINWVIVDNDLRSNFAMGKKKRKRKSTTRHDWNFK